MAPENEKKKLGIVSLVIQNRKLTDFNGIFSKYSFTF